MGNVAIKTTVETVSTASSKILDANTERKYLSIQNKSADNTALIKFGEDFVAGQDEVQLVTFEPAVVPTGGGFKLEYDGVKTAEIAYDDDYSDVQTALRAIEGLEEVEVTGDFENGFEVTFTGTSGHKAHPLLAVTDNDLLTDETELEEAQKVLFSATPTGGTYKLKFGANKTAAIAFDADAAAIQTALRLVSGCEAVDVSEIGRGEPGFYVVFTGTYSNVAMIEVTDHATLVDDTTEADEVQTIYANMVPTEGTFKLQFKGEITAALEYGATALQIQTALRALSTISDDTTVSGTDLVTGMAVTFTGADGAENQPLITPYEVNLIRHGEELRLDVYQTSDGSGAAAVTAVVTEEQAGAGDTNLVATVAATQEGVADDTEGLALEPGAMKEYEDEVPVDAVWAVCDDATALIEIMEG